MLIDITAFTGMRPAVSPRLLEASESVMAVNVDTENGDIYPLNKSKFLVNKSGAIKSVYMQNLRNVSGATEDEVILAYTSNRTFVDSPIDQDQYGRVFMSNDDSGGLTFVDKEQNEYTLGVITPTASPKIASVGMRGGAVTFSSATNTFSYASDNGYSRKPYLYPDEPIYFTGDSLPAEVTADTEYAVLQGYQDDNGEYSYSFYLRNGTREAVTFSDGSGTVNAEYEGSVQNRAYVYTLVDEFGQESAPSYPVTITCDISSRVGLTDLVIPTAEGYPTITARRLYRSATGESGATSYQFVREYNTTAVTVYDDSMDEELGETLMTVDWDAPPSGLKHLHEVPHGIFVAHTNTEVMFSDVFFPYAWPAANRYTVGSNINTIAVSQNTVFALTDGLIYAITVESDGSSAYVTKLDGITPCVSARGVVECPMGVLFPGEDGLYLLTQGVSAPSNITQNMISEREWKKLNPSSFIAAWHDDYYMAFFTPENGTARCLMINVSSNQQARMRYLDIIGTAINSIPVGDRILYAKTAGTTRSSIYQMFGDRNEYLFSRWKSKLFQYSTPINFSALRIESYDPDRDSEEEETIQFEAGAIGIENDICGANPFGYEWTSEYISSSLDTAVSVKIEADGTEVFNRTILPNVFVRLPKGYAAKAWQIQVSTGLPVTRVALGTSIQEMR